MVTCALCGREIARPLDAYRKVSGYVRKRGGGGVNGLRLREVSNTFACVTCVDLSSSGVAIGQGGLFDE